MPTGIKFKHRRRLKVLVDGEYVTLPVSDCGTVIKSRPGAEVRIVLPLDIEDDSRAFDLHSPGA